MKMKQLDLEKTRYAGVLPRYPWCVDFNAWHLNMMIGIRKGKQITDPTMRFVVAVLDEYYKQQSRNLVKPDTNSDNNGKERFSIL